MSTIATSSSAPDAPNRPPRVVLTTSFVSSPLNPSSPLPPSPHVTNPFASARSSRPGSRASHVEFAQTHHRDGLNHGSMLLYRLASDDEIPGSDSGQLLPPPKLGNRASTVSVVSVDSKYPVSRRESAFPGAPRRVLVAYEYDPPSSSTPPPPTTPVI